LSVIDSDDNTGDGNPEKKITNNTYNDRGQLIRSISTTNPSTPFSIGTTLIKNLTYNAQGKLTLSVSESEFQVGTIPTKFTQRETYNNGKLTLSESTRKIGDEVERNVKKYDNRGNLISSVESRTGGSYPSYEFTTNNTYDKQNNLIRSSQGGETTNNTYDKQNNLILSIRNRGDRQSTIKNTYNQQGKLTLSLTEYKVNGKLDERRSTQNTYNQKGNSIASIEETDRNGDGNIDERTSRVSTYDGNDQLCGITIVGKNAGKADRLTNYKATVAMGGSENNLLTGTNKADILTGGGGSDIFVVKTQSGVDTITDFKKGEDLIGLGKGISFNKLSFSSDSILFGGDTLATLTGVQTSTLTASDFINI
jgi:YD repeat-containing protein